MEKKLNPKVGLPQHSKSYFQATLRPKRKPAVSSQGHPITAGLVELFNGHYHFVFINFLNKTRMIQYRCGHIPEKEIRFSYKLIPVVECPYHPAQFYTPETYCDLCYSEEKDKL